MEGVSGEQVGDELESVTISAEFLMHTWLGFIAGCTEVMHAVFLEAIYPVELRVLN